jgi:pantothenate kinase-related protein Tda10
MKTLDRTEFKALLKSPKHPLITLTGPSGVGKSYWAERSGRIKFSFSEPIEDIYKAYTEQHDLPEDFDKRRYSPAAKKGTRGQPTKFDVELSAYSQAPLPTHLVVHLW